MSKYIVFHHTLVELMTEPRTGVREMAQRFRVLLTWAENLGLIPNTHMVVHSGIQGPPSPSSVHGLLTHMHTFRQNIIHTKENEQTKKKPHTKLDRSGTRL